MALAIATHWSGQRFNLFEVRIKLLGPYNIWAMVWCHDDVVRTDAKACVVRSRVFKKLSRHRIRARTICRLRACTERHVSRRRLSHMFSKALYFASRIGSDGSGCNDPYSFTTAKGFPRTGVAEFLPTPCRTVRSMVTFSQPQNVDMMRE